MTTDVIIGKNIKNFRVKLGLRQEDLAEYLGISREEISYYETAKRSIPTGIIEKAAKVFGIDEFDLYEEDIEKVNANIAFAFRADFLAPQDLNQVADFRKIVLNYLNMSKIIKNESTYSREESK